QTVIHNHHCSVPKQDNEKFCAAEFSTWTLLASFLLQNRGEGLDMNVQRAWDLGYTGKDVVVTILDDGIEKDHPDLKNNYLKNGVKSSFYVFHIDRFCMFHIDRHGTRCAGEVAAIADNGFCSVGVAFNAKIGGVRMLDGDVTDSVEAQSLSLNPQHIQIYSASWGPDDDGRTVDGPATLARKAFYDGISKGRGGLGSIFVWASGNGGRDGDSCNCDGYTNTIYTLSISSATENGDIPWYSEACSSTLATTYSSGSGGEKQIVTTDLRKSCTETHTGTSASAPLAAGLCSLALQANPMLTWRDLQHIVVMTAKPDNLHALDWNVNGVNRKVSHSFGYGLMDAGAMVELARNWTTVPPQHICEIRSSDTNRPIPVNGKITVPLDTDGCEGTEYHVKYLEHVQARITLTASRRGEVQIFLISPMNTRSTLLARRVRDISREGFNNWAFMTTHNWGEFAKGRWKLVIENGASSFQGARLKDWVLVLRGTDRHPLQLDTTTSTTTTTSSSARKIRPRIRKIPPQRKNKSNKPYSPYLPFRRLGQSRHESHMCIFKTLAKQNNTFSPQYRMTRANLSSAELKDWALVARGTASHPQMHNITQRTNDKQPFMCSGITTNGVCIECRPGYYKLHDGCVFTCPEHYYGTMETIPVQRMVPLNTSRPTKRQGVCHPCNEACQTCRGPHVVDCFQCNDGYEIRDEYCRKKLLLNFLDPDMLGFFVWVIVLCISAILLFGVVFGILQARDHHLLCWKEKRHFNEGKGKYNGLALSYVPETLANDSEHLNVIQNMNFNHGHFRETFDKL
ncbi:hypothetical protein ScPMuIL_017520, partial [Solemya velum]